MPRRRPHHRGRIVSLVGVVILAVGGLYLWHHLPTRTPSALTPATVAAPQDDLKREVEQITEKIRAAHLNKDINKWLSCYASTYPNLGKRENEMLELWKNYDIKEVSYRISNVQRLNDRQATADIVWNIQVYDHRTHDYTLVRQGYKAILEKSSGGWRNPGQQRRRRRACLSETHPYLKDCDFGPGIGRAPGGLRPQYYPPPLPPTPPPRVAPPPQVVRPVFYIKASHLNLRACPGMDCPKVSVLERGEAVEKVGESEDWFRIPGNQRWPPGLGGFPLPFFHAGNPGSGGRPAAAPHSPTGRSERPASARKDSAAAVAREAGNARAAGGGKAAQTTSQTGGRSGATGQAEAGGSQAHQTGQGAQGRGSRPAGPQTGKAGSPEGSETGPAAGEAGAATGTRVRQQEDQDYVVAGSR